MILTPTLLGDALIVAIFCLMPLHAWHLHKRGQWMLLDPLNLFWAGIFVCYVEQPIRAGDIFISWHDEAVFNKTLFATLFGIVFVVLGYQSRVGTRAALKLPALPPQLSADKLFWAALALAVLGLGGYYYLIDTSGGLDRWLSVARGGTDYERVVGYWGELTKGLPAGVALLVFRSEVHRDSLTNRLVGWFAASLMWLWYLYLGSRSGLILFSVVLLACYYLPRRRSPHLLLAAALFVILQTCVNLQQYYRDRFTNLSFNLGDVDHEELLGNILPDYLGGNRELRRARTTVGSEFSCGMAVVRLVPQTVPYNYGYGFLEVFTRPVPRALWPGKRYPHLESVQGVLRAAELSTTPAASAQSHELVMGPAFAFVGHWYYVGGFIGLLIGGTITGILFKFVRSFHDRSPTNQSVMLIYPFLLTVGFAEAASTPWYWVYTLPFVVIAYLAIVFLCRETPSRLKVQRRGDHPGRDSVALPSLHVPPS